MTNRKKVSGIISDYFLLSVGVFFYCIGWTSFMVPNGISSGGLTGICTILQFATDGRIPISASFFVINTILIVCGTLVLGKGFGFKTIYAYLLSSLLLYILPKFDSVLVVHFSEKMFVALLGGFVEALGISMVLNRGGSTGGMDIVALIINKFWPVSLGRIYLFFDVFIIFSIVFIPGKGFEDMMYGYLSMVAFSLSVDWFTLGPKSTYQVLIFSRKYKEIADRLIDMDRGVTALNSVGWYSGDESKVLLVIVRKSSYQEVVGAVKEIDSNAFVSVSKATSVYGARFEEIKTGVNAKKLFDVKNRKKNENSVQ